MPYQARLPKISAKHTNAERLLRALSDAKWHSTRELVRRVGHTFGCTKFRLVLTGYEIEKRSHPRKRRQWEYRLVARPTD